MIDRRGGNSFYEISVPQAVIKFKQGFGRLIRTRTDVGVVILLDRRVLTRPYGRVMLAGLPPASRAIGPWAAVRAACEEFFGRHGIEAAAYQEADRGGSEAWDEA